MELTKASEQFGHDIEHAWRYGDRPPANLDSRLAAIEAEAVTTFLQSDRAESLLAEALHDYNWGDTKPRPSITFRKEAKAILASLLEEMKP